MGYLSASFLSRPEYSQRPRNAGVLFDVIRLRYMYGVETWAQTCARVVEASMKLYSGPYADKLTEEAELMFDMMYHLESLPSGRAMRIAGTPACDKYEESAFNCSYLEIKELEDFCEVFHLSLCSCGVGADITKEKVSQLPFLHTDFKVTHSPYASLYPEVKKEYTTVDLLCPGVDYYMMVGDSKDGWVEALRQFLKIVSTHPGASIVINYNYVRPEGSKLVTWGGRAAGPEGLKNMFIKLEKIIKKSGGKLRPIHALDICTIIGKNVVVGGSRRAAMIMLFSPDDQECIEAKFGDKLGWYGYKETGEKLPDTYDWDQLSKNKYEGYIDWIPNPEYDHRTMSNNSMVLNSKPSLDFIKEAVTSIRYNGEPGIFNRESAHKRRPGPGDLGLNPCLTADTWINTSRGPRQIKELVDTPFHTLTFDNKEFSPTGFWSNGVKPVFRLTTDLGYSLELTEDHKIFTSNRGWVKAKDLTKTDSISLNHLSEGQTWTGKGTFEEGWLLGNFIGDGCYTRNKEGINTVELRYWGETKEALSTQALQYTSQVIGANTLKIRKENTSPGCNYVEVATRKLTPIFRQFGITPEDKVLITPEIEKASSDFYKGFIQGIFDADGSPQGKVEKGFSIRLAQSNPEFLLGVQRMLLRLGIVSKVYSCRKEAGMRTLFDAKREPKDYWCKQSAELIISRSAMGIFHREIGFSDPKKALRVETYLSERNRAPYRSKFEAKLTSLELIGNKEVYDCTVETTHRFDANGVIVHNCAEILLADSQTCNLSTVPWTSHIHLNEEGEPHVNFKTLEQAYRLAVRVGMRQTNVTLSLPEWDRVQKRDRLLGVSITGEMSAIDKLGWIPQRVKHKKLLEWARSIVDDEVDKYSYEMRIPKPLLATAVKPEGSLTLLTNAGSCGVHRAYAPAYIRRLKFAEFEPTCQALKELGVPHEKDKSKKDSNRWVFEFPVLSEATMSADDEPVEDQLERYLLHQRLYTQHNTSITLYVGEDEWDKLPQLLLDNWDEIIAVSFLPKGFKGTQMPMEERSIDEIKDRLTNFPDLSKLAERIAEIENGTHEEYEILDSCGVGGGQCPIV